MKLTLLYFLFAYRRQEAEERETERHNQSRLILGMPGEDGISKPALFPQSQDSSMTPLAPSNTTPSLSAV